MLNLSFYLGFLYISTTYQPFSKELKEEIKKRVYFFSIIYSREKMWEVGPENAKTLISLRQNAVPTPFRLVLGEAHYAA